ncbi:MAG: hypothetical protein HQ518_22400 [Rhodopirellula sp.]|nr:hypothetical protein [Rhodopirellula sp.]
MVELPLIDLQTGALRLSKDFHWAVEPEQIRHLTTHTKTPALIASDEIRNIARLPEGHGKQIKQLLNGGLY